MPDLQEILLLRSKDMDEKIKADLMIDLGRLGLVQLQAVREEQLRIICQAKKDPELNSEALSTLQHSCLGDH